MRTITTGPSWRVYGRAGLDVAGHAAAVYVAFGPHGMGVPWRSLGVLGVVWAVGDLARERAAGDR